MPSIDGLGPTPLARVRSHGKPGGTTRFSVGGAAEAPRGAVTEAAAPVVAAGMLALQEAANAAVEDREARRHGRALLAALSRLQHQLLGAGDADAALDALATLLADMPRAIDPSLAAALNAVALRAHVELARRAH